MSFSKAMATFCVATVLSAGVASADSVSWRATSPYPATTNSGPAFEAMKADLAERTGGEFELVLHPGASLGFSGSENLGVVQDGIVEVAETLVGDLVGSQPLFGVLSLPFLTSEIDDIEVAMAALTPEFDALLAQHDQIMLGWGAFSSVGIFSADPVGSLEELSGQKLRVYDAFSASTATKIGASPVQLPFSEVVTAVSAGTIDGLFSSTTGGKVLSIWDMGISAYIAIEFSIPITILHVSKPAFDRLTADQQAALRAAGDLYTQTHWRGGVDGMAADLALFKDNGMAVVSKDDLDAASIEAMTEIGKVLQEEWVAKHGDMGRKLIEIATQ